MLSIDDELSVYYSEKLGNFSYGPVYEGKYVLHESSISLSQLFLGIGEKIEVAVKEIIKESVDLLDGEILIEVRNHKNVLRFYCVKENTRFWYIYILKLMNYLNIILENNGDDASILRINFLL